MADNPLDGITAQDLINAFQAQWPKEFELTVLRLRNARLEAYLVDDITSSESGDG